MENLEGKIEDFVLIFCEEEEFFDSEITGSSEPVQYEETLVSKDKISFTGKNSPVADEYKTILQRSGS